VNDVNLFSFFTQMKRNVIAKEKIQNQPAKCSLALLGGWLTVVETQSPL